MKKQNWTVNNILDQIDKIYIITGATSGLGKAATRILAGKNATVVLGVRNTKKAEAVKKEIREEDPDAILDIMELDLSDLSSIKRFACDFEKKHNRLDVLINNAGVMMCPYSKTKDGFEIQMGTNHLGPFALTGSLISLLKNTKNSRVVSTSSLAHLGGNINMDDLHWEKRKYKTNKAYSDSKIANLYFTYEMKRRFKEVEGFPTVVSAHPGWTKTDLQKHSTIFRVLNPIFGQKSEIGVLPTLRAATDPQVKSGDYYGPTKLGGMRGYPMLVKSNDLSQNEAIAKRLWDISEEMTNVRY